MVEGATHVELRLASQDICTACLSRLLIDSSNYATKQGAIEEHVRISASCMSRRAALHNTTRWRARWEQLQCMGVGVRVLQSGAHHAVMRQVGAAPVHGDWGQGVAKRSASCGGAPGGSSPSAWGLGSGCCRAGRTMRWCARWEQPQCM